MAFLDEHRAKFDNLRVSLELRNRDHLKRTANGGNSIIFLYPPNEENLYITKAKELFGETHYKYINIAQLLVKFIDGISFEKVERKYKIFRATPYKVFNSGENSFLNLIISEIQLAQDNNQTAILIRTGALYGTGIENVNIMEHSVVMSLSTPLILFYPAKIENENLYFLNFKPASKYRCTVIE